MVLLGDEAQVEACFGLLDIVLIFKQDRCTVCARQAHVESHFIPFGDSVNVGAK